MRKITMTEAELLISPEQINALVKCMKGRGLDLGEYDFFHVSDVTPEQVVVRHDVGGAGAYIGVGALIQ